MTDGLRASYLDPKRQSARFCFVKGTALAVPYEYPLRRGFSR